MKQELQQKIYEQYGDIFTDRTKNMSETCMCWGLDVGDGWYHIIENLCERLHNIQKEYDVQIVADQVKEKFGTLRFYYHTNWGNSWTTNEAKEMLFRGNKTIPHHGIFGSTVGKTVNADDCVNNLIDDTVSYAEALSEIVCETCGMTGGKQRGGGWIITLCDKCFENTKNNKK